ncbi:S41 family peptidase [Pseudoduganella sp. UC29_71]|uniref:S41 family peptidase n=1 Tax=Pseudoduganella sp. UC29_71 TaxID=3350174 RepID=UPI00366CBB59
MPLPALRARAALLLSLLASAAGAADKTAADWQAAARADLDAVHQLILTAHPGSIDELNPGFKVWAEQGYREAGQLLPRVNSYDSMMAAVRYYVTGFRDGHLLYSDNARRDYTMLVNGWRLRRQAGSYVVDAHLKDWPAPLPPLGAALLQCDGRKPDAILAEDVAPYLDRRATGPMAEHLPSALTLPALPDLQLKRCQFRTVEGALMDMPITYQGVPAQRYFRGWERAPQTGPQPQRRSNKFTFEDGVLWVSAASFNTLPSKPQIAEFDAMLAGLARLEGVRLMVFDVRGNGGGSSAIGDRIFTAATGGLDYDKQDIDKLPRTYAQWRVSDLLLETTSKFALSFAERYGPDSAQARQSSAFLKQVQEAKAKGATWVEQPGGHLLTRAEIARRGGKLRRYSGPVVLLTDSACASACLDFADLVLSVPGAIHAGRTTSADTLYIDTGRATLPSGNVLVVPQKVWRNRLRGSDEALAPGIVLKADLDDDAAVRAETLAALAAMAASANAKPRLQATP